MEIEMLDAPEVREGTAIQQTSIALVQGALTEFDKVAAGLADLKAKYGNVVYAVGTAPGMAEAKAARLDIRAPRYAVDRVLKATKEPLNAIKKELDDRAGQITAALLEIETPIHEQIRAEEDRKAAEKAERDRIAAEQKLKIDTAINWMRDHAILAVGASADDIAKLITSLNNVEVTLDSFADRAGEAEQCRLMTLGIVNGLHTAVLAQEAAAAQVEAARIQLEQERAEQARAAAEQARIASEAAAAAAAEAAAKAKAEADAAKAVRDAEQAEFEAKRIVFQQEQADMRAKQAADLAIANKAFAELEEARAAFKAEQTAKLAADQKAIDDAALAAEPAPVAIEPAAGIAEIITQAASDDVEYITATAIDPNDADLIFCAAAAVANQFGMTFGNALHRLAAIDDWVFETETEGEAA